MPAASLQQVLEQRHGLKIFVTELKRGSGATFRGEFGDAMVVNAGEAPGRRAFSIAHELFHLLTWDCRRQLRTSGSPKRPHGQRSSPRTSRRLSCCLETPSPRPPAGKPADWTVMQWVELARSCGVSVPALAWRLVNLAKLQRQQAEKIIADPSRRDAGAQPAQDGRELPDRFVTLAFRAFLEEEITVGKLAELLETTVGMLRKVLRTYGYDMDSDVWQAEAVATPLRRAGDRPARVGAVARGAPAGRGGGAVDRRGAGGDVLERRRWRRPSHRSAPRHQGRASPDRVRRRRRHHRHPRPSRPGGAAERPCRRSRSPRAPRVLGQRETGAMHGRRGRGPRRMPPRLGRPSGFTEAVLRRIGPTRHPSGRSTATRRSAGGWPRADRCAFAARGSRHEREVRHRPGTVGSPATVVRRRAPLRPCACSTSTAALDATVSARKEVEPHGEEPTAATGIGVARSGTGPRSTTPRPRTGPSA